MAIGLRSLIARARGAILTLRGERHRGRRSRSDAASVRSVEISTTDLRVLITGAGGTIGSALRDRLRGRYGLVRLSDIDRIARARPGEEVHRGDLADLDVTMDAMQGIDCVVHLGAISTEDSWESIRRSNIDGTYNVFESARRSGVRRVIFASSSHVVGFHRRSRTIDSEATLRPDTRYGVSKVVGEALGRYYADKHGLEVVCLRIGSFRPTPRNVRELSTWISPDDMIELVRRCIEVEQLHFLIAYGVSDNERSFWDNSLAARLGYRPVDDAETFTSGSPAFEPEDGLGGEFQGGSFCEIDFSGDPTQID